MGFLRENSQLNKKAFVNRIAIMSLFLIAIMQFNLFGITLETEKIAGGFSNPIFVTSPPHDSSRLFVVEQTGRIKIVKNGSVLPNLFLDISSLISSGGERGLLGMAFHPEYNLNGYFFLNYTDVGGNSKIVRGKQSANPDISDPDSLITILTVPQPFSNHNAGMLAFSPIDGFLYIGLGDGGSGGDPGNRAQDSTSLLGKMLRIDIDNGLPYTIPADNPYLSFPNVPNEIWAFGLRNPWRYSFDRETGDLYIADVGQSELEEIDFQLSSSPGGVNYGWRLMEGSDCFNPATNCNPGNLILPIYEYSHSGGCSVSGGYVYRGCAIPELPGAYFFADYCSNEIWSLKYDGANLSELTDWTSQLVPEDAASFSAIVSFGEDAWGELYIVDRDLDAVYKIVSADRQDCNLNNISDRCDISSGSALDLNMNFIPDECEVLFLCGDANNDSGVNVSDAVFIINYVFVGGDAPDPIDSGEVNCDDSVNVSDAVYIINYVFVGGTPPCDTNGDEVPDC